MVWAVWSKEHCAGGPWGFGQPTPSPPGTMVSWHHRDGLAAPLPSPPRSEAEKMLPALSPWISLPPPRHLSLLTTRPQGRALCVYLGLGAQELAELAQAGALNPPRLPPTVALLIVYIGVC